MFCRNGFASRYRGLLLGRQAAAARLPDRPAGLVRRSACRSEDLSSGRHRQSASIGAAGAVGNAGVSTTKVRSPEGGLMGQWACRPTTIRGVGGVDPSWLRIADLRARQDHSDVTLLAADGHRLALGQVEDGAAGGAV